MPECRINLGHCAVALSMAPKSTRAYKGLKAAYAALSEPGKTSMGVSLVKLSEMFANRTFMSTCRHSSIANSRTSEKCSNQTHEGARLWQELQV